MPDSEVQGRGSRRGEAGEPAGPTLSVPRGLGDVAAGCIAAGCHALVAAGTGT